MSNNFTMENILAIQFNFGAVQTSELNRLRVSFRKTIQTAQYESETFECETEIQVPPLSNIELSLINGILEAQLEYTVYTKLYIQGMISKEDFNKHREKTVLWVTSLIEKTKILKQTNRIEFIGGI